MQIEQYAMLLVDECIHYFEEYVTGCAGYVWCNVLSLGV